MAVASSTARAYRKMLVLARRLPQPKRGEVEASVRSEFRKSAGAAPEQVSDMLEVAERKIRYVCPLRCVAATCRTDG